VLLAEHVAAALENAFVSLSPARRDAIMGAMIALLVLLPESVAALKAASRNAMQRSLNISLGSALASIGLTIPVIGAVSLLSGREIVLGLPPRETFLLLLALAVSFVSFGTERTNVLTGLVHLVVFATFMMTLFLP
jgi:Ca2+:H+ antiporter